MLTAPGTEADRIVGLELGADDYVVKPFSGAEVIARIRAILRRSTTPPAADEPPPGPIGIGPLEVDLAARRVRLEGQELQLSRKEFDLLAELVRAGRVVTREQLMDRVSDETGPARPRRSTCTSGGCAEARRRPGGSALPPHGPGRRLPVHRSRGALVSLRTRLLLALAYVLVLAVVALEVPLIISLRDRVDAEVRSQARGQAEIVAASVVEEMRDPEALQEIAGRTADNVRGRVIVVGPGGRLLADSAGEERIGIDYSTRPGDQRRARGRRVPGGARQRVARPADPRDRGPRAEEARPPWRRPHHAERRRRCPRDRARHARPRGDRAARARPRPARRCADRRPGGGTPSAGSTPPPTA